MPISQLRMIALINAGSDFEQAFVKAVNFVSKRNKLAREGQITVIDALKEIDDYVRYVGLLARPWDSSKIIALEKTHFNNNARKNERAAQKTAQKRGQSQNPRKQKLGKNITFLQFTPERTNSPDTMARDSFMLGTIDQEATEFVTQTGQMPDEPLTRPRQYGPDPSLDEDQETDLEALLPSTLTAEDRARLDREMEQSEREKEWEVQRQAEVQARERTKAEAKQQIAREIEGLLPDTEPKDKE